MRGDGINPARFRNSRNERWDQLLLVLINEPAGMLPGDKRCTMGGEKEERDSTDVFLRLLLIGNVFAPPGRDNEEPYLDELFEKHGFTPSRSECTILEKTTVGDSTVTIARYSLEYRETRNAKGKKFYFEGDLAMQVDRRGHLNISISAKPGFSPPGIETFHPSGSQISNNITSPPFISPPRV